MKKFNYKRPDSLEKAVSDLTPSQNKSEKRPFGEYARIVAGGTDIVGVLKTRISPVYPDTLVSLKDMDLRYIKDEGDYISIGAMTTLSDIEKDGAIEESAAVLKEAAHNVATPQIRHQATIGGNICQEPRCWYYRYPDNHFHCMRKGGKLCNALTGKNAYHSIDGAAKVVKSPCETGCPNSTNIPAYFDAIRKGDLDKAAKIFMQVNPMGAVTGRICPHDCQSECNRNEYDDSVGIWNVERFIGDYALKNMEKLIPDKEADTGKSIGIIGGGPAGLTAAYYLCLKGHSVTVYDKNRQPGGMLAYSIPAYRLPQNTLDTLVQKFKDMGIEFVLGSQVDPKTPIESYKNKHDSVLISCGAWDDNEMTFNGSDNALSGLEFLYKIRTGEQQKPGDKVVVIGGGNVAIDVAVSARRMGSDVTIVYRRTIQEMPAHEWEVKDAIEEGVKIIESKTPFEITTDGTDVKSLEVASCISSGGRGSKITVDNVDINSIQADSVILAIGQQIDSSIYKQQIEADKSGRIGISETCSATGMEGVFAAGDVVTGPATVVEAIAGGRKASYGIHEYLTGEVYRTDTDIKDEAGNELYFDLSSLDNSISDVLKTVDPEKRLLDKEDAYGLDEKAVKAEANRCFNCGCVAVTPSDVAPALVALDAQMITTERIVGADDFFRIGIETSTILNSNEILKEIRIPVKKQGNRQSYQKFRTRKSIDFPIAGLASNLKVNNGKIEYAKLVLGGAMPVPKGLPQVEEYLIGKTVSEDIAEEAGSLASERMTPLKENGYKVDVFKALVRRAVLEASKK